MERRVENKIVITSVVVYSIIILILFYFIDDSFFIRSCVFLVIVFPVFIASLFDKSRRLLIGVQLIILLSMLNMSILQISKTLIDIDFSDVKSFSGQIAEIKQIARKMPVRGGEGHFTDIKPSSSISVISKNKKNYTKFYCGLLKAECPGKYNYGEEVRLSYIETKIPFNGNYNFLVSYESKSWQCDFICFRDKYKKDKIYLFIFIFIFILPVTMFAIFLKKLIKI